MQASTTRTAETVSVEGARHERIVVLGLGHVGFPLALLLARAGYLVMGVDISIDVVDAVNAGDSPIPDGELRDLLNDDRVRANLRASTEVTPGDTYIIAVPTPLAEGRRVADMGPVVQAAESIRPYLKRGDLVILESTVPPLTCREVITPTLERGSTLKVNSDVGLAHCPERALPGKMIEEMVNNDRVIGSLDSAVAGRAKAIFEKFCRGRIFLTDDVTAEMIKLMENTYRDVNIALANEFAMIAERVGVDIRKAIEIANAHPRVQIHRPGIGVGGPCIPVVPWFLVQVDSAHATLISAARDVNDSMPQRTATIISKAVSDLPDPELVLIGLSYKPETQDARASPAVEVALGLRQKGLRVRQYDPFVTGSGYASLAEVAAGADLLAILVPHAAVLRELDATWTDIRRVMRTPRLLMF